MIDNNIITDNYIKTVIKPRDKAAHKGNCGRVLIMAGGAGMTGAAIFSARAALRSGAGLVYLCTAPGNFPVLQTAVPEAICTEWEPVLEHLFGRSEDAWHYDAIAFGPGMGTSENSRKMLRAVLMNGESTLVIDADGLNCLSADKELRALVRSYQGEVIITPHVGEARRLLAAAQMEDRKERPEMVSALAEICDGIAVLKGAGTLVCRKSAETGSPEIWINPTGNPGMATAGSGDVLTGVIASLAGQGLAPLDAARAGVYLHGRAGDLAAAEKGEYGLIASDIAEALPYALKEVNGR